MRCFLSQFLCRCGSCRAKAPGDGNKSGRHRGHRCHDPGHHCGGLKCSPRVAQKALSAILVGDGRIDRQRDLGGESDAQRHNRHGQRHGGRTARDDTSQDRANDCDGERDCSDRYIDPVADHLEKVAFLLSFFGFGSRFLRLGNLLVNPRDLLLIGPIGLIEALADPYLRDLLHELVKRILNETNPKAQCGNPAEH